MMESEAQTPVMRESPRLPAIQLGRSWLCLGFRLGVAVLASGSGMRSLNGLPDVGDPFDVGPGAAADRYSG